MAARLDKVLMDHPISPTQSVFIKGTKRMDGVMVVVNEVIDLDKNFRKKCFVYKLDFEKAYIYWDFLDNMLGRLDFDDMWQS